jgi:hypothetical protein
MIEEFLSQTSLHMNNFSRISIVSEGPLVTEYALPVGLMAS